MGPLGHHWAEEQTMQAEGSSKGAHLGPGVLMVRLPELSDSCKRLNTNDPAWSSVSTKPASPVSMADRCVLTWKQKTCISLKSFLQSPREDAFYQTVYIKKEKPSVRATAPPPTRRPQEGRLIWRGHSEIDLRREFMLSPWETEPTNQTGKWLTGESKHRTSEWRLKKKLHRAGK